jgi:hypothetical protein
MHRLVRGVTAVAFCVATLTFTGATAFALETPTTGQPGAPTNTCGAANGNPVTPGGAASAPGSPFNPLGQAGNVYAGNPLTASLAHSNSAAAVSQYDTACVRLSH